MLLCSGLSAIEAESDCWTKCVDTIKVEMSEYISSDITAFAGESSLKDYATTATIVMMQLEDNIRKILLKRVRNNTRQCYMDKRERIEITQKRFTSAE